MDEKAHFVNPITTWWRRHFGASEPRHVRVLRIFLADPEQLRFVYDLMREAHLSSGRLYLTLASLEADAWITSECEDINEDKKRRLPRRGYRLTEAGRVHARTLVAKWQDSSTAPAVRPTLAAARLRADELMGRPGPDADGYVYPFAETARDMVAALLYAGEVSETDHDQICQWARTQTLEPYELLTARVVGEAEDPDACTAGEQVLNVYQNFPVKSRDAVMIQVIAALTRR